MSELNVDTPIIYCSLRAEYLYNGLTHKGELIPCAIFAASSLMGRAIGFHCMLDNGALIYRLPISAFVHKSFAPDLPLDYLELWDCFSPHMTCNEYEFLQALRVDVVLKDRSVVSGTYMFTLDWYGNSLADNPGEGGHKCAHIIQLENGCYAAQPNNRIRWHEPSFITAPFPAKPDYQTNNRVFSCENKGPKWRTDSTDKMFYEIEESCPKKSSKKVAIKLEGAKFLQDSLNGLADRVKQNLKAHLRYPMVNPKHVERVRLHSVKKVRSGGKVRKTRR